MKPVYDALGTEISVGDYVAFCSSGYVKQDVGVVTKLGNKNNALITTSTEYNGYSYTDGKAIVIITATIPNLKPESRQKLEAIYNNAQNHFDYTRPKSGNSTKHLFIASHRLNRGWVISYQDDTEKTDKFKTIMEDNNLTYIDRNVVVRKPAFMSKLHGNYPVSFKATRYHRKLSEERLSMKSLKEIGVDKYVDDFLGFELTDEMNFTFE